MELFEELELSLTQREADTVGDAFGGYRDPSWKRLPNFGFTDIVADLVDRASQSNRVEFAISLTKLRQQGLAEPEVLGIVTSCFRFSFLIELTNLDIGSTKLKTKFCGGKINKTRPESHTLEQVEFCPSTDVRAATFIDCKEVFLRLMTLISQSRDHVLLQQKLHRKGCSAVPHEGVFTYVNYNLQPNQHKADNVKLTDLALVEKLVVLRPILYAELPDSVSNKIKTKTYKTDRSLTGTDQTNRAKRWEVLPSDFQFASIEDCWSVELTLLIEVTKMVGFPQAVKNQLVRLGINVQGTALCAITLGPLNYEDLKKGSSHGESDFQVGHNEPLKRSGKHVGSNVSWISGDGNRYQGSDSIEETRAKLFQIFQRYQSSGLFPNLQTNT